MTTLRLLLVDDEELFTRGLSRELSRLGWEVQTARDTESALRRLREDAFDALVVDLQMPGRDGVHVLAELGELPKRPVAILLSGYLNVAAAVRAVQVGADDVLEKPVAAHELDVRLRGLLATHTAQRVRTAASVKSSTEFAKILGDSAAMCAAREQMEIAARYPELWLMIVGESGTGKEQVAEAIHRSSGTLGRFVPVNLAPIPDHLIELELFGSEAEGNTERRRGLFELGGNGTLFFKELGELPPPLHGKLLHAFETRTFRRLGGESDLPLEARILVGTRRRTAAPEFAELYDRLASFTIHLPALRERRSDIELIAAHVLAEPASRSNGGPPLGISAAGLELLMAHTFPGNVRELEIVLSAAASAATVPVLSADDIRSAIRDHGMPSELDLAGETASGTFPTSAPMSEPLRTLERRMITDAWRTSGRNLSAAARSLGLPRTTLRDRLKKYGLR